MPGLDRPFLSLEALHETRLDDFKEMYRSGGAMAVPAALDYCAQHGLVAPAWLANASADLFCKILRLDTPKTKGRSNGFVTRLRQDMIDYARWDAVCEVLDKQKKIELQFAELRTLSKVPPKILKEREKMRDRLGHTLDRAFECAEEILAKTRAGGGLDTIERSYRKVEKAFKNPNQAMRYHLLDSRFLQKIGLKI
jgi:hypothetical protein